MTAVGQTVVKQRRDASTGELRGVRIPDHLTATIQLAAGVQAQVLVSSVIGALRSPVATGAVHMARQEGAGCENACMHMFWLALRVDSAADTGRDDTQQRAGGVPHANGKPVTQYTFYGTEGTLHLDVTAKTLQVQPM